MPIDIDTNTSFNPIFKSSSLAKFGTPQVINISHPKVNNVDIMLYFCIYVNVLRFYWGSKLFYKTCVEGLYIWRIEG